MLNKFLNIATSKYSSLVLSVILSFEYIACHSLINWAKVNDVAANAIYYKVLIPFTITLALFAFIFFVLESFKIKVKYFKLVLNILILGFIGLWFLNLQY